MRINTDNNSMDMETRDINYILPAYVRSYLFYSKNQMPTRIIFPMFEGIVYNGVSIPIEWVPPLDPKALEIQQDGSNVPEVTEEQERQIDEKDTKIEQLTKELESLRAAESKAIEQGLKAEETKPEPEQPESPLPPPQTTNKPPESPARAAFNIDPDPSHQPPEGRVPRQPSSGDIGPGVGLSDMSPRDRRDNVRTARDLIDEPDVNEAEEIPYEKSTGRGEDGRPTVEDKPKDDTSRQQ